MEKKTNKEMTNKFLISMLIYSTMVVLLILVIMFFNGIYTDTNAYVDNLRYFYSSIIQALSTIYVFFFTVMIISLQISKNERVFDRLIGDPLNKISFLSVTSSILFAIIGLSIIRKQPISVMDNSIFVITLLFSVLSILLLINVVLTAKEYIKPSNQLKYEISEIKKKNKNLKDRDNTSVLDEELTQIKRIFNQNREDDAFVGEGYKLLLCESIEIRNYALSREITSIGAEIAEDSINYKKIEPVIAILRAYVAGLGCIEDIKTKEPDLRLGEIFYYIIKAVSSIGQNSKLTNNPERILLNCLNVVSRAADISIPRNEKMTIIEVPRIMEYLYNIHPVENIREYIVLSLSLIAQKLAKQESFSVDEEMDYIETIYNSIMRLYTTAIESNKLEPRSVNKLSDYIEMVFDSLKDENVKLKFRVSIDVKLLILGATTIRAPTSSNKDEILREIKNVIRLPAITEIKEEEDGTKMGSLKKFIPMGKVVHTAKDTRPELVKEIDEFYPIP